MARASNDDPSPEREVRRFPNQIESGLSQNLHMELNDIDRKLPMLGGREDVMDKSEADFGDYELDHSLPKQRNSPQRPNKVIGENVQIHAI